MKSGTVQILSEEDNETAVISLESGTCLGEASLIINVPAKVSVKAAEFTEVYVSLCPPIFRLHIAYSNIPVHLR